MGTNEFLIKHSQEFSKKYPGKYIAVVEEKLVAVSNSALEAFKKTKKKYPKKRICIDYIPTKEETVTLL